MTKAWTINPTGYADITVNAGECVIISEDQRCFWPDCIRVVHKGRVILIETENLTLDPHFQQEHAQ